MDAIAVSPPAVCPDMMPSFLAKMPLLTRYIVPLNYRFVDRILYGILIFQVYACHPFSFYLKSIGSKLLDTFLEQSSEELSPVVRFFFLLQK